MTREYYINSDLYVTNNSKTKNILSPSISAVTFFGNINAQYIGNKDVTNTKFSYLSGLTGYVQNQLFEKLDNSRYVLSYSGQPLNNERVFTGGTNLSSFTTTNNVIVSHESFSNFILKTIDISTQNSLNDYSPTSWDNLFSGQTIMKINPTKTIKISGVANGVNGRNLIIKNVGENLIIFENLGTASTESNRFLLQKNKSVFLMPKSSIEFSYNTSLNKWVQTNQILNQGLKYYDSFERGYNYNNTVFPFTSKILWAGSVTYPQRTQSFVVNSNPSGYSPNQTAFKYVSDYGGSIKLFRGSGSTVGNRTGVIGVGNILNQGTQMSSEGFCMLNISEFTVKKNVAPFLGASENWAIVLGLDNNRMVNNYGTITTNFTTFPNFGGGCFWLFDWNTNQNNALIGIQSTGGTTNSAVSSFNLSNITGDTLKTFGIFYKSKSGSTSASCTYFWAITSGASENYTIENELSINGAVDGLVSLNFYGGNAYDPQSNIDNTSGLVIKNFGYNYLKL
jgi:hypothetical protein